MKKIIVAAALALTANSAFAALSTSSHYLPGKTISGTAIAASAAGCAFCHMPHAGAAAAGAPLWARNLPVATGYSFYNTGGTGSQAAPTSARTPSLLCLSCHDGTQSVARVLQIGGGNQYLGGVANDTLARITGNAQVGPNLQNDHPISVTFVANGAYGGMAATVPAPFTIFNGTAMVSGVAGGTVECTSCHDAHASRGASATYPNRSIMVTNGAVDYCSGCHSVK
jgi:hypothetical protein